MKRLIFPATILLALLLSACTNYFQVLHVASDTPCVTTNHDVQYKSDDCTISYNFWGNHGTLSFDLQNNTNQTLHVNLDECFVVINNHAFDFSQLKVKDGDKEFSNNTVSIPAGAYRHFTCPTIRRDIFELCNVEVCPDPQTIQSTTFKNEESPLHFGMSVTYTIGQNTTPKIVANNFFVDEIINYHKRNFEQTHDDTLRICNEEEVIEIQDVRSADKFFIEY